MTSQTIVVDRDYRALRRDFIAGIEKEKTRNLLEAVPEGPFHYPEIFHKTSGMGAARAIKDKIKLIKAVEPTLGKLLFEGEEVRFLTRGIYCSFAEQYFLGWMSHVINRTVFLYTNFRVILMNTDGKHQPLHMKWHIPYSQINKFSGGVVFSSMTFKLKDKKKFTFAGFPKYDRKPLKSFTSDMVALFESKSVAVPYHASRDNLCTSCFQPVPPQTYECGCGEQFISPGKPTKMSLLLPCLGDLYLGHRMLGIFELVGYAVTWLIVIALIGEGGPENLVIAAIILAATHGFDAALTNFMAKKGLVSLKNTWGRKG